MYVDNENRFKTLDSRLAKVEEILLNVTGSPIFKAWNGVRFDLNADLDVLALNKELKKIHGRLDALDTVGGGL